MAEYQNLFTKVQVRTAPDWGVPIDQSSWIRQWSPRPTVFPPVQSSITTGSSRAPCIVGGCDETVVRPARIAARICSGADPSACTHVVG